MKYSNFWNFSARIFSGGLRNPAGPQGAPAFAPTPSLPFTFCPWDAQASKEHPMRRQHKEGPGSLQGPLENPCDPCPCPAPQASPSRSEILPVRGGESPRCSGLVLVPEMPGKVKTPSGACVGGECQTHTAASTLDLPGWSKFLFLFKKGYWLNML